MSIVRYCAMLAALASNLAMLEAHAVPVLSFSGQFNNQTGASGTRGWEFNVNTPGGILVTHIGLWDESADGLAQAHEVGIWSSSQTLLTSATVPSGIATPLDVNNLFRLVDIPDIVLAAGAGYHIGAVYLTSGVDDFQATQLTGFNIDPAVTHVVGRFTNTGTSTLTFPSTTLAVGANPGMFGPSFEFEAVATPEPTTALLLGAGLLGAAFARKRRTAISST